MGRDEATSRARGAKAARQERRSTVEAERLRAFAEAARVRFPGLPPDEEIAVARYALRPGTSRVGRVAAGEGYLGEAVELAVVSHARHRFTSYERRLAAGDGREQAREAVRGELAALLRAWAGGG